MLLQHAGWLNLLQCVINVHFILIIAHRTSLTRKRKNWHLQVCPLCFAKALYGGMGPIFFDCSSFLFLCQAGSDILSDNCTYIQVHMGFKVTRSSSAGVCLQESNFSSGYLHGLPLCGRWWYTCLSEGDICCHPEKTQMLYKECLAWKCNNRADLIYNSCVCLLFHPVCWWHFSDNVSCGRADSLLWTPRWCREVWAHRLADNASSLCVSFHPEPQHTAQSRS